MLTGLRFTLISSQEKARSSVDQDYRFRGARRIMRSFAILNGGHIRGVHMTERQPAESDFAITRRDLMVVGGSSMVAAVSAQASSTSAPTAAPGTPVPTAKVSFDVNGRAVVLDLDTRTTLLDALREHLHLTGTKKGCDHGQCGACTVIVDGRRINACLSLAVMHEGGQVTTIEGLGQPGKLHPMQAAFVKHDGYQCGYCTPGQICSAVAVLDEIKRGVPSHVSAELSARPSISVEELRERMSGNICRCGAYSNIVDAVFEVSGANA